MGCVCKVMKAEKESSLLSFCFLFSTLRTLIFNAVPRFCFVFFFSFLPTWKSSKPILFTQLIFSVQKNNACYVHLTLNLNFLHKWLLPLITTVILAWLIIIIIINIDLREHPSKERLISLVIMLFYNTDHVPVTSWVVMWRWFFSL